MILKKHCGHMSAAAFQRLIFIAFVICGLTRSDGQIAEAAVRDRPPSSSSQSGVNTAQCDDILHWLERIRQEYPGLDLYRTTTTLLYPKIANLYREAYFKPVFGTRIEDTDPAWRKQLFFKVILPCSQLRSGTPTYAKRFHDFITVFFRPLTLDQGSFGYGELTTRLSEIRSAEAWRDTVLRSAGADVTDPAKIEVQLTQGKSNLASLWPSELASFGDQLRSVQTSAARKQLATLMAVDPALSPSRENAALLQGSLARLSEVAKYLPASEKDASENALKGRLEAMLDAIFSSDREEIQKAAGSTAQVEWFKQWKSRNASFQEFAAFKNVLTAFGKKRNAVLEEEFAALEEKLNGIPTTEDGLRQIAALENGTFMLPDDAELPVYRKFKAAAQRRTQQIDNELKSAIAAQNGSSTSPARQGGAPVQIDPTLQEELTHLSIPDSLKSVLSDLLSGRPVNFTDDSYLYIGGMAGHFTQHCPALGSSDDRLQLVNFVAGVEQQARFGNHYTNRNFAQDSAGMVTMLLGFKVAEAVGCDGKVASTLADAIVAVVKSNQKDAEGGASVFLRTCAPSFDEARCDCLANLGRAVISNIYQEAYSRQIILRIIQGNPMAAIQIGFVCHITNY